MVSHIDPLIIPIIAILMPLVMVPTIIVLKQQHKRREWEHLERMRAMEIGLPPSLRSGPVGSGSVAVIGAGVPIASVLGAFLTSLVWQPSVLEEMPVPAAAWLCAVFISAGGLVAALSVSRIQARAQHELASRLASWREHSKPVFDPDTFDVVGTRG